MMLFAGAFSRVPKVPLAPVLQTELAGVLSRFPGQRRQLKESPGFFLASTVPCASFQSRTGLFVGRPLLVTKGVPQSAADTAVILTDALQSMQGSVLLGCRGTFAAVSFDSAAHRLVLATDRLGVWPIYWHVGDEIVTFASALRILEGCPSLRLSVDFRGAIESASFGYHIGERTPYARVYRARAAELAGFEAGGIDRRQYFDWSTSGGTVEVDRESLAELYSRFQSAVELRLNGESSARAFLSGGLDSRCIVAALAQRGTRLTTYNISWNGSLDQRIGRQVAERLGTDHRESIRPLDADGDVWPRMLAEILRKELPEGAGESGPLGTMWAGEGGSVGVGRVLVSAAMLAPLRRGAYGEAISAFMAEHRVGVPAWTIQRRVKDKVLSTPGEAMREEILAVHPVEPGQRLFLFLMLNDQRCHLAGYFEQLDLNRVEYLFPFYDAEFLSYCVSMRLDDCIDHRMYNRWTELFPPIVRELPWQHYPGHEPSPVPLPAAERSQWDRVEDMVQARRKAGMQRPLAIASSEAFPAEIVDARRYRIQLELHRRGLRDYSYLFDFVGRLEGYWRVAQGRCV